MKPRTALTTLLSAGAFAVAGCGGDDETPQAGAKATGNGVDRAFAAAMIPHHESAVQMAAVARKRGESAFVKDLADDITRTQTEEIATLKREEAQLAEAGVEKGSIDGHGHGGGEDSGMLESARPFDKAFVDMMVPHHQDAVQMARAEIAKGADPELKSLARRSSRRRSARSRP
jgi:uncharacterized protein (DUF305 family)